MIKRAIDVVAAAAGLLLLSPVLAVAAAAVRLTSPGPVLFRQERVGRGFRPFHILKFRTMYVRPPEAGLQITAGGDPRVTRVGRVLRRWKIDELPQLVNAFARRAWNAATEAERRLRFAISDRDSAFPRGCVAFFARCVACFTCLHHAARRLPARTPRVSERSGTSRSNA